MMRLAVVLTVLTAQPLAAGCTQAAAAGGACPEDESTSLLMTQARKANRSQSQCRYRQKVRVRREWRTLDEKTKWLVVDAFWTMKNTSTLVGQRRHGKNFYNYDEILIHHSCSTQDPRCDQGHFGPHFILFHRALLLEMELSLLSVHKDIKAMPYWNIALDAKGGKYYRCPEKWFFSSNYAGAWETRPEDNHEVRDGLFAGWPISLWTDEEFGPNSEMANRTNAKCLKDSYITTPTCSECAQCYKKDNCTCPNNGTHFLRMDGWCAPKLSRWPQDPDGQAACQGDRMNPENCKNPNGMGGSWDIIYDMKAFEECADPSKTPHWMDWQDCIEISAIGCSQSSRCSLTPGTKAYMLMKQVLPSLLMKKRRTAHQQDTFTSVMKALWEMAAELPPDCQAELNHTGFMLFGTWKDVKPQGMKVHKVPFMHSQIHIKAGIDFLDVTTSPNDPPLFTGYHAFIDASNMQWMEAAYRRGYKAMDWTYPVATVNNFPLHVSEPPHGISGPASLYDFMACAKDKGKFNEYPPTRWPNNWTWLPGTMYQDVSSSAYPYKNLFSDYDGGSKGYTHAELLLYTSPERTPYAYDILEHLYCNTV